MKRISVLLLGLATLALTSAADARDGCGRGWYFNGVACVPQHGGGGPYYNRPYRVDPGTPWAPNFGGNVVRPTVGRDGKVSCSNPNYTWQDGACRPYRGPRG